MVGYVPLHEQLTAVNFFGKSNLQGGRFMKKFALFGIATALFLSLSLPGVSSAKEQRVPCEADGYCGWPIYSG